MDYEDVANISNLSTDADITPEMSSAQIAHEIVFVIFCLCGMVADTLIIYTILKFPRLRTVSNKLLANWAIADILSLLVTPSSLRIISVIHRFSIPSEFFCILMGVGLKLHANTMMFAILVCLNWALESYFKKCETIVKKYYQIGIGLAWIVTVILISMDIGECLTLYIPFDRKMWLLIVFIIYVGLVVLLQMTRAITKCCRKPTENSGFMLNLATVFLACWSLAVMSAGMFIVNHALQLILECLLFSSSILNLMLLYFFNQDFQAHLLQVVKCSRNKYQESSLSFDNPIVRVKKGKSDVEVTFSNPNNAFLAV